MNEDLDPQYGNQDLIQYFRQCWETELVQLQHFAGAEAKICGGSVGVVVAQLIQR
jgi:hypothetical protein